MKVGAKSYNALSVKEISIVSEFDGKKELIRMSKKWISYKLLSSNNDYENWSNQLGRYSETYDAAYEYLRAEVLRLFEREYKGEPCCQYDPGFNIRITFNDGVYCDLSYKGDMANNDMGIKALTIKRMCVPNIVYPEAITVYRNKILTDEVVEKVHPDDIRAILIAAPSAKGRPSTVEVLIGGTYYMSRQLKKDELQYVVLNLFNKLNIDLDNFNQQRIAPICQMAIDKKLWWYINLGANNQLILQDREFNINMDILLRSLPHERYIMWRSIVSNDKLDISFLE